MARAFDRLMVYTCRWGTCTRIFSKHEEFEDHVLTHIIEEVPEKVSSIHSISSGRSLAADDEAEIDLVSSGVEEDELGEGETKGDEEEEDDIVCILCNDGSEHQDNQIVICDGCDLGYHQKCHPTLIPDYQLQVQNIEWLCYQCEPASTSAKRPRT